MQYKTIFKLFGYFLMLFSISLLLPLSISVIYKDGQLSAFFWSFLWLFGGGLGLVLMFNHIEAELKIRDGFLFVGVVWVGLSLCSALPFLLILKHFSYTDCFFEAISGLTTTGASIIKQLDALPISLLIYRQMLQFLGGMGMVVLAIAILPMLGIGGMQLYQAEMPGPFKEHKLTPRIAQTAKILWLIYVFLTACCCLSYYASGMTFIDAIGESFTTVSTGGFTMHDTSFEFYHNDLINVISCIFMILGSINFTLHALFFSKKSLKVYLQDEECMFFLSFLFIIIVLFSAYFIYSSQQMDASYHKIIEMTFHIVSLATTTGFSLSSLSPYYLLFILAIIGGCTASTSGGIKMLRAIFSFKLINRELTRMVHPQAVIPIKYNKRPLGDSILQSIWAFIIMFMGLFLILFLTLLALGNDGITAATACIATLANAGVGLGQLHDNFFALSSLTKWLLMIAMIAGRLELFTLLVLFSPSFWRK